jgi:TrmH family RNA methyltransferase
LTTENPQPVAALIETPDWTWAHLLDGHRNVAPLLLVLAGLQDPGNLGTILRSAEAFGASGVLSLPGTVSAWNPKAVRASAGSVFRLPLLSVSAEDCFEYLREADVKIWTTAIHSAEPADRVNLAGPIAILIGNEGNGVPLELAAQADGALTIPCPGPVESLNASIAASILLYEAARQRSVHSAPLSLRGTTQ